jgi:hypothetical protein
MGASVGALSPAVQLPQALVGETSAAEGAYPSSRIRAPKVLPAHAYRRLTEAQRIAGVRR